VPVIDLRGAVAPSARDSAPRPSLGVLVERDGELHALLAERIEGAWDCGGPERPATAVSARLGPCCAGIALRDERPVVILNLASLLTSGAAGPAGDWTERDVRSGKDSEPMFQHEDWEYGR
jgi:chemotaxis signal transduction protein